MRDIDNKIGWRFDNTYVRLSEKILTKIKPTSVKQPKLIIINESLSKNLGLNFSNIDKDLILSNNDFKLNLINKIYVSDSNYKIIYERAS